MYTILINDDNTTIASVKERIMERSNLMNSFRLLVNPEYTIENQSGYDKIETDTSPDDTDVVDESNIEAQSELDTKPIVVDGIADMSRFRLLLEYTRPISKRYKSEYLTLTTNEDGTPKTYKGKLEFKLPVTTDITKEPGEVEMKLTFIAVDLGLDGKGYQYIRKVDSITIPVIPVSAWTDIIPDEAFAPIDQRIIKTDAQIKALLDAQKMESLTKADNLVLDSENKELYLTAEGEQIGDKVKLSDLGNEIVYSSDEGLVTMMI